MDPRSRRSRERLSEAVLAFASEGRLDDVSVSELALRAGVTRDTFYRHTSSVPELLAGALSEELGEIGRTFQLRAAERPDVEVVVSEAVRALFEHIAGYAVIYRTALTGESSAPLRRTLVAFLERHLAHHLLAHPEIAPVPPRELDGRTVAILVGYGAAGIVGALESWLRDGDVEDIDGATRLTFLACAAWWTQPVGV